jgi:DnaK suppressor protein
LVADRARTVERLDALVRDHDAVTEAAALDPPDDEHDPDGATIGFERAQLATLVAGARAHLVALDRAIERLGTGAPAHCARCGRPIPVERLLALPGAVECLDCAARAGTRRGRR